MADTRLDLILAFVERSRKRLAIAIVIALGLHVPFTPAMPLFRLLERFMILREDAAAKQKEEPPPPQLVEVELKELARQEEIKKAEEQKIDKNSNSLSLNQPQPSPPAKTSSVKFSQGDNKPAEEAKPEPQVAPPAPDKKKPKREVGLDGKLSKELTGKPALTLGVWFASFRDHPLGKSVGQLLACDPEWKAFFKQGVDPLRDFDGTLIVGPSVSDARKMTAAVRHHLPPERVKSVMGAMAEQSGDKGKWLRKDVVTAKVGRTSRALFPHSDDMFFVTPSDGWEVLHDVTDPLKIPSADGRAMSLAIRKPATALTRLGVKLPARLQELRLDVFANVDQSVDVRVELDDLNEAAARADARKVSDQLRDLFADLWATTEAVKAFTGLGGGEDAKPEPAPTLTLAADEKTLTGTVHFSAGQAKTTLELLSSFACKKRKPSAQAAPSAAP